MGQNISIDSVPLKLADLKSPPKSTKTNFSSNIKIWSVSGTIVEPIRISSLKTFSEKNCYIVLHLFRKGTPTFEKTRHSNSTEKYSIYELARSSLETQSPRGTSYPFSINEFLKEESYTLYLYNGKKSSVTSQTLSITTAFEIEKHLENSERLFDCGEPEPIGKYFKEDFYDASTFYSPDAFEYLLTNCALARFFKNKNQHQNSLPSLGNLMKEHNKSRKVFENNKENRSMSPYEHSQLSQRQAPGSGSPHLGFRRTGSFTFQRKGIKLGEEISGKSPNISPNVRNRRMSMAEDISPLPSPHRKVLEKNPTLVIQKIPTSRSIGSESSKDEPDSPRPNPSWGAAEMVVYFRKVCSEMRPYFYLGSDYVARSKDLLKKHGITHVVNAARVACDNYFPDDFTYMALNLYDSPSQNIIGIFFQVIDFIESAISQKKGVYVHCYQGVSRSSAIVIAYIMWKEKTSFRITNEDVKERRQVAAPNAGFTVQLMRWEKIMAQKSQETWMYRLSPLNDRYQEHRQSAPQLCDIGKLDTRTCFILYTFEGQMFIWAGKKSNENIIKDAEDFAKLLHKLLKGIKENHIHVTEGEETPEFNEALKRVITPDALKRQINANNPYPELDDFDKEPPKFVNVVYKIEPIVQAPREKVEEDGKLYLFDGKTFENLTTFDSDDLDDGDVFILESQKDMKLFVWIGADMDDVDYKYIANEFIKYFGLPEEMEVIATTRDDEPEEFWNYFTNG